MPPRKMNPQPLIENVEEIDTKEELLRRVQECLSEHGGQESNIPFGHDYWTWMNQYRYLAGMK